MYLYTLKNSGVPKSVEEKYHHGIRYRESDIPESDRKYFLAQWDPPDAKIQKAPTAEKAKAKGVKK